MRQIWSEHWRYDRQGKPTALAKMCRKGTVMEPIGARLDCAVSKLDELGYPGLVLFSGGCGAHPALCERPHGFFKSAVLYDSLLDEWEQVPDMPTRRHGPASVSIGQHVYVLGGQYVDVHAASDDVSVNSFRFCDILMWSGELGHHSLTSSSLMFTTLGPRFSQLLFLAQPPSADVL